MNYRYNMFDSKLPDVILTICFDLFFYFFNRKGCVEFKAPIIYFTTKSQTRKCALGLVLLVISIINNLCAKYDTILTLPIE